MYIRVKMEICNKDGWCMITVCMTTYNGERFIKKQLDSIYKQTKRPDEVIICDDGSIDNTVDIVKRYIEDKALEKNWKLYINKDNKGYPDNAYYSMELAKGDVVFLADQDDVWSTDKIEKMSQIIKHDNRIQILACKMGLIDEKDTKIHTIIRPNFSKETEKCSNIPLKGVLYKNEWSGMVLAYRSSWYQKHADKIKNTDLPHDLAICIIAASEDGMYQMDKIMAWHRRHNANTAKEEHRIGKLMLKERKEEEISTYLTYLDGFIENKLISTPKGIADIHQKQEQMKKRLSLLEQGKSSIIILNYIKYHREVRFFTMLCDVGICLIKKGIRK